MGIELPFPATTRWNLENFRGRPGFQSVLNAAPELFRISGDTSNRLTILNLTRELDEVRVFCGSGTQLRLANFTLKIYRKMRMYSSLPL